MKKNYFKSIGLIFLGVVLSSSVTFYSLEKPLSINNQIEPSERWIPIEKAQQDIAAYQMWLKFLPKFISIEFNDSIRVKYHDRAFAVSEWTKLKGFYDLAVRNNPKENINLKSIPFHTELNTSYFISKDDIDDAFDTDDNANGINVYLALRGQKEMSMEKLESHLYVLPTQKINDTVLKDKLLSKNDSFFALDLTHPCPALCDKESKLYNPELKPLDNKK